MGQVVYADGHTSKGKRNGGVGRYLTTKVKTRAVRMGVRVGGGKEFQLFVGLGEGWGR